jgi:hypothetical protein
MQRVLNEHVRRNFYLVPNEQGDFTVSKGRMAAFSDGVIARPCSKFFLY